MNRKRSRRRICQALCISIFLSVFSVQHMKVYGANKMFTLSQAQNLALAKNKTYQRTKNKIAMQQVKYTEAVKSIQLKRKNMSTFRWSPLLSFKFPQKPDLADEFEWQYKPAQIQTKIGGLNHQLQDTRYEALEKVSVQYVKAYIYQEKITFVQKRLKNLEDTIARNEARVITGQGSQADVDKMKASKKKLENDMSLYLRSQETTRKKIGDLTGMDITTGYRLSNPLVTADIGRQMLSGLISHTLEEDQSFYEAKLTTQLASMSLNLNESFMRNQYGGNMNMLQTYLNQAKSGQEIDGDAFKMAYDQFLVNIDAPWQGQKRILFIRFPKEWLKGAIDGVRYVEDEPYALYTAALDYQDALQDQTTKEKELTESVTDSFETLITARNAYQSLEDALAQQEAELEKSTVQNKIGELPYEELSSLQQTYEETQMDCLDSLASYSELLYSFDRLTCGGITVWMKQEISSQKSVSGGDSYLVEEAVEGAWYYMESKVEDNIFVFGLTIPDDFAIDITAYELWVDGTRIGERSSTDKEIRHLTLAMDHPKQVTVRLYDGEKQVDEVEIDPQVPRGELKIQGNYQVVKEEEAKRKVAVFSYETDSKLNTTELSFQPVPGEAIAYYLVTDAKGTKLYQQEMISILQKFRYLSVLVGDISQLRVIFYDSGRQEMYQGTLEELTRSVMVSEG